MQAGISPKQGFDRAIRNWWWLVVFLILGGVVGWLISRWMRPVYSATAEIAFNIEYAQTGQLTDIEEDRILGVSGDVLASDQVLEIVVNHARQAGLVVILEDVKQKISLERKDYIWRISVSDTHAQTAYQLVNSWSDEGYLALLDALDHANTAYALQQQYEGYFTCLSQASTTNLKW
jgi:hypothetical protein